MKPLASLILSGSLIACAPEQQEQPEAQPQANADQSPSTMEVSRSASRPAVPGPAEWFTGAVTLTPLFDAKGRSQVGAAKVRFEAGSRTAWQASPGPAAGRNGG